ncbi:MAG: hypothetical protein UR61_C0032G0010 [candidate division WS6 bacterium GW2011_GWE1_34_7]|uniref:Uncharacterized protein n=1 Tax=candidate division WS6 bacterium GW2011_GWE1_34_7 TaxID=1619093 RepID=A0A0G0BNC8_9BACT|nr:MAG: hypothetical protein UR61_C0032G0010 [candidate division WS6 bacterium GW2011_GWE1_34_7]
MKKIKMTVTYDLTDDGFNSDDFQEELSGVVDGSIAEQFNNELLGISNVSIEIEIK